jgi:hypothetical protein
MNNELCYNYSVDYYLTIKKKLIPVTCNNMKKSQMHYVKWKKVYTKDNITICYSSYKILERQNYNAKERVLWLPEGEPGDWLQRGTKDLLGWNVNVFYLNCGGSY